MNLLRIIVIIIFIINFSYLFIIKNNGYANNSDNKIDNKNYYALLVGVSKYPSLAKDQQLRGPENDVHLLKKVFSTYYFNEENITVLSHSQSDALQPKYAIIVNELQKLVDKTKANDKVLLYFSGHGSQQPNPKEMDGYDEIFLPSDIGQWHDDKQQVKNALVDNEIGAFIDQFLAKKVSVWLIMDSCHAATGARTGARTGAKKQQNKKDQQHITRKARTVSLADLGAPKTVVQKIQAMPPKTTHHAISNDTDTRTTAQTATTPHFIGFYASAADEEAFEDVYVSLENKDKKAFHGNFSYTLAALLQQKKALSYRELQQSIRQHFRKLGVFEQNPQYEGAKDLMIFSNRPAERVDHWELKVTAESEEGQYYMAAGKTHGFAKGMQFDLVTTVLETQPLATVKITQLGHNQSTVCLVDQHGKCVVAGEIFRQLEALIDNGELVWVRLAEDAMIPTLTVYVSDATQHDNETHIREKLLQLKKANPASSRFIKWIESKQDAEVIINFPSELSQSYQDSTHPLWLHVPSNADKRFKENIAIHPYQDKDSGNNKEKPEALFKRLIDKLYIINKTLRLKELAKEINDPYLQQSIAIKLFKKKSSDKKWQALDHKKNSLKIKPDYDFGFTLTNNLPDQSIDLGLFMLMPNYESVSFSCYDADNSNQQAATMSMRLAPQQTCIMNKEAASSTAGANFLIRVLNKPAMFGRYYVLMIATIKAVSDLPEDYAYLLQPSIGLARAKATTTTTSKSNKIARYLRYFSLQGHSLYRNQTTPSMPDSMRVFIRLIELDIGQ